MLTDGSGRGIEGMLNGTITSLSDKWSSAQLSGTVDIRLTLTRPLFVGSWTMPVLVENLSMMANEYP